MTLLEEHLPGLHSILWLWPLLLSQNLSLQRGDDEKVWVLLQCFHLDFLLSTPDLCQDATVC